MPPIAKLTHPHTALDMAKNIASSRVGNKHSRMLINFPTLSPPLGSKKAAYLYKVR